MDEETALTVDTIGKQNEKNIAKNEELCINPKNGKKYIIGQKIKRNKLETANTRTKIKLRRRLARSKKTKNMNRKKAEKLKVMKVVDVACLAVRYFIYNF